MKPASAKVFDLESYFHGRTNRFGFFFSRILTAHVVADTNASNAPTREASAPVWFLFSIRAFASRKCWRVSVIPVMYSERRFMGAPAEIPK